MAIPSSEMLHASTVAINGQAVLITGVSGSGKSDLALRLIDRGAKLVSDDYWPYWCPTVAFRCNESFLDVTKNVLFMPSGLKITCCK